MGSVVAAPSRSLTSACAGLRARHVDRGTSWSLELSGEADVATLDLLREELAQLRSMNRDDVVVDVHHLTFCDVASAHLLRTARRTIPVTLSGATGPVKRVFDLLDELQMHRLPGYLAGGDHVGDLLTRPRLSG